MGLIRLNIRAEHPSAYTYLRGVWGYVAGDLANFKARLPQTPFRQRTIGLSTMNLLTRLPHNPPVPRSAADVHPRCSALAASAPKDQITHGRTTL